MESTKVPAVDEFIRARSSALQDVKMKLSQAQNRMKVYADQNRTERHFNVGDFVYLKLQPYKQTSIAQRSSFKLSPRYYGPYEIIAKVGTVAYRLKLPAQSQIHNVFHVSLLKKTIGAQAVICPALPPITEDGVPKLVPEKILSKRMVKYHNRAKVEYLIQWAGSVEEDATWEDAEQMVAQFPDFNFATQLSNFTNP